MSKDPREIHANLGASPRACTGADTGGNPTSKERPLGVLLDETWNLADLYPNDEAFLTAKKSVEERLPSLHAHRGHLGESATGLAVALEQIMTLAMHLNRLHAYATMKSDMDTRVAGTQAMRQEVELLFTSFATTTAYLRPEILGLGPERLDAFLGEPGTLSQHAHFLRNLARQRSHILEPSEERIVAEASLLTGGPTSVFGVLHNADLPRAQVTLASGEEVRVTPAAFSKHRTSPNREDRRNLYEAHFGAYVEFQRTLGANLYEAIKAHVFRARVRGYDSCLEAALDADNVPSSVYRNLIRQVHENLPVLHRYFRLRARALDVDPLRYHDLSCPLSPGLQETYTVEQARGMVIEAVSPLGGEYVRALEEAFGRRWVDWHPAPGKRSGAYASGAAYEVHPYMLLNFHGAYDGVSTLAHEAGHAMHSYFSNRKQPYATADYPIFVAEVASTFNEALLNESLLRSATRREEKLFLLTEWLDRIRATFFRQSFFAEFELAIHEQAERGHALTCETLCATYLDLLRLYQGHELGVTDIAELYGIEWASVPHFYYDFYVYQYSTGIVAATTLAQALLEGEPGAQERYLTFLTSGGSDYPLALLRRAGVDLESPEPYQATIRAMDRRLDELEDLLERIPRSR